MPAHEDQLIKRFSNQYRSVHVYLYKMLLGLLRVSPAVLQPPISSRSHRFDGTGSRAVGCWSTGTPLQARGPRSSLLHSRPCACCPGGLRHAIWENMAKANDRRALVRRPNAPRPGAWGLLIGADALRRPCEQDGPKHALPGALVRQSASEERGRVSARGGPGRRLPQLAGPPSRQGRLDGRPDRCHGDSSPACASPPNHRQAVSDAP